MDPTKREQPKVFVTVPSYNHAPFVEKCLRSIISQTLPPSKLLVIDDGSSDGSPEIISKVLEDCPFPSEFIARENRGLCATLNQALVASDGEYFAYLGSDDLWLPQFLDEQTTLLEKREMAVLAFCHAYVIDEQDGIVDSTNNWSEFTDGDARPMLLEGTVFSSPGVVYRASALQNLRWNEESRLEDYEMYLRLTARGEFARNKKILCAWRQHGVNASGDLPLMYGEMIAAQNRVGRELGIGESELARVQERLRFRAVENLARYGFRGVALRWFASDLAGADSLSQIVRNAVRLTVPQSLFQWNRRRKLAHAAASFGKLGDRTANS